MKVFGHVPASFGVKPKQNPLFNAPLKLASPSDGCIVDIPECINEHDSRSDGSSCQASRGIANSVLLIERGKCNFTDKIHWAQSQGALVWTPLLLTIIHRKSHISYGVDNHVFVILLQGVVVMDDEPRGFKYWGVVMSSDSLELKQSIDIPSIFVSYETGNQIKSFMTSTLVSNQSLVNDEVGRTNEPLTVTINEIGNELAKSEKVIDVVVISILNFLSAV